MAYKTIWMYFRSEKGFDCTILQFPLYRQPLFKRHIYACARDSRVNFEHKVFLFLQLRYGVQNVTHSEHSASVWASVMHVWRTLLRVVQQHSSYAQKALHYHVNIHTRKWMILLQQSHCGMEWASNAKLQGHKSEAVNCISELPLSAAFCDLTHLIAGYKIQVNRS